MFSTFVYIFFILMLEVGHGVVSYVADEGVWRTSCLHGVDIYYMRFSLDINPVPIMHKGGYLRYSQHRRCTYMATLTEVRSCNHCCSGKATCITCTEFVFVALLIQHAMRMRRIVICSLSRSTIFFHFIS